MGVYIKGMEMPEYGVYLCEISIADDDIKLITIHDQDRKSFPLVPVPDHGDLIDRDELAHEMWLKFCENCIRAGEDMCNFCTDKQYIDLIVNYPATISAERSEA